MTAKVNTVMSEIRQHVNLCRGVLKDSRTPKQAKILLGFSIAYLPFPLSFLVSPILIFIALKMISKELIEGYKLSLNS